MIRVTHFSDPGCPWAWSNGPAFAILQWRYGAQLQWRHAMIGLGETAEHYRRRGTTGESQARNYRKFRHRGMPFATSPRERPHATWPMCRGSLGDDTCSTRSHKQETSDLRIGDPAVAMLAGARIGSAEYDMTIMGPSSNPVLRSGPERLVGVSQWVACPEPECFATAEVIDRYVLDSSDRPVSMVRTRCIDKHIRDWVDATA